MEGKIASLRSQWQESLDDGMAGEDLDGCFGMGVFKKFIFYFFQLGLHTSFQSFKAQYLVFSFAVDDIEGGVLGLHGGGVNPVPIYQISQFLGPMGVFMNQKQENEVYLTDKERDNMSHALADEMQRTILALTRVVKFYSETGSSAILQKLSLEKTIQSQALKGRYVLRLSLEHFKTPLLTSDTWVENGKRILKKKRC